MTVQDSLLPDFDEETASTRRLLARVPEADLAWKPHERSFSLGELSMHLARLLGWGRSILDDDAYDLKDNSPARPEEPVDLTALLAAFDDNVAAVRRLLATKSDAELTSVWELRRGGTTLMAMPRVTAFRRFVLHHLVHHRGQLSVCLRLRNVPLPPIYGPTADERM